MLKTKATFLSMLIFFNLQIFGLEIVNKTCGDLLIKNNSKIIRVIEGNSNHLREPYGPLTCEIAGSGYCKHFPVGWHTVRVINNGLCKNNPKIVVWCDPGAVAGLCVASYEHYNQITKKADQNKEKDTSTQPSFTFKNLAGSIPEEITEVVEFLKNPERFTRVGAKLYKGILLIGPPGTGKTAIARAIAGEANAEFVSACGSDFINVYVGTGPNSIRELFTKAREAISNGIKDSAIIFIDEIDAIAGSRGGESCSEYRNTLNALLHEMDGFKKDDRIMVIAATNTPDYIDRALKRPGRFDRIIHIGLPDKDSRLAILKLYANEVKCSANVNFETLAQKTEQWSAAELQNLMFEAARVAARKDALSVTSEHFDIAFEKLLYEKINFRNEY